jgi:hypothetical protein
MAFTTPFQDFSKALLHYDDYKLLVL